MSNFKRFRPGMQYPEDEVQAELARIRNFKVEPTKVTDAVDDLLRTLVVDAGREGLAETPERVAKAWQHWLSGYEVDIPKLLKSFEDGAENYSEQVIVKNVPIYSKCEHHLADIFGTVTIAYIPNGRVLGLSKLSRLADAFARRLQVQERMTAQIADALANSELDPKWVGVYMRGRHMCMESRGLCQQGHYTVTSAFRNKHVSYDVGLQLKADFLAESRSS